MDLKQELKVGDTIEIEIAPGSGEYKATTVDGTDFIERFSLDSLQKVVDNWKKEGSKPILCDVDHSSVETDDTEAAGWVERIWADGNSNRLMGSLTVSSRGASLLNGLEYRYVSPVLFFTEDNFPFWLDSIALTNTPRLEELRPVYNSKSKSSLKEPTMDLNLLRELLGLSNEATEDEIKAEVLRLKNLETELKEEELKAEEARLEAEAEELANNCSFEDEESKEIIKNSYRSDSNLTKAVVNVMLASSRKLVINSAEARKPELKTSEAIMAELKSVPGGQASVDFLLNLSK